MVINRGQPSKSRRLLSTAFYRLQVTKNDAVALRQEGMSVVSDVPTTA
jgi:hypothetical protein